MRNRSAYPFAAAFAFALASGQLACSGGDGKTQPPDGTGGDTATGGARTGGARTGGASTGGAMATGGGFTTGGASTGGASTGGASTGGGMGGMGGMGGAGTGGMRPDAGPDGAGTGGAGTGGAATGGADGGGMPGAMTLMSDDLLPRMGTPPRNFKPEQCNRGGNGTHNISPTFMWTAGPAGTMSYALSMYDMANNNTHWVLYNIPPTVMSLPKMLDKTSTMPMQVMGATQTRFAGETGYFGPGADCRTYRFEIWALKVAQLPTPGANNAIRMALPNQLVNPMAKAIMDVRGQNSGAPCP